MCNWLKKIFGGKACCEHCDHCGDKSEDKKDINTNAPVVELKSEASQEEKKEEIK